MNNIISILTNLFIIFSIIAFLFFIVSAKLILVKYIANKIIIPGFWYNLLTLFLLIISWKYLLLIAGAQILVVYI